MTNPAETPTRDRRIGAPIQSVNPDYDATIELHREIQRQRDEIKTMTEQIETLTSNQPAVIDTTITITPRMDIAALMERDQFIRDVIDNFLVPGIDFGPLFPNAKENGLKKSGAEKFAAAFGLFADYIEVEKVVERAPDSVLTQHIRYEYRCDLHIGSRLGPVVGTAIGICSSEEDKYKWRLQKPTCPTCGAEAIRKSNYGGWYCSIKDGGCNAKFTDGAAEIENQPIGRIINPDMMGLQHTIAAMAQKRAFVLAVRSATGLSAYFAEIVIDEDDTRVRAIVDSKATHKSSATIAAELIKYAESLLPEGHGYTRNQIGLVCLDVLGMKDWNDDYNGTIDDAKQAIARRINEKFGNGESEQKTTQDAKTASKSSANKKHGPTQAEQEKPAKWQKSKRDAKSDLCAKCEQKPRLNDDSPYPFLCGECAAEQIQQDTSK